MKLCIVCHKNKAEIPDRNVQGRPIKRICKECHRKRIEDDMKIILNKRLKDQGK